MFTTRFGETITAVASPQASTLLKALIVNTQNRVELRSSVLGSQDVLEVI